ncbi:MAG: DUF1566 domain-containing protein [Alistipes sp.]|nr:DUF1566 domain-containing protein [Alistipes sp.]
MKPTKILFALLSVAMLFPAIAAAQGFEIFVKKKVAVADVIDRNDRELTEGVKTAIRQSMMDVCTNSEEYAVYEVNMDDVKQQLKAKGLPVNFANICKIIKQKADYIIFPAVKVSTSALGARDVIINITATLYRLDTGTEHLSRTVEAKPDVQSIITSSSQMVAQMLGIEQTTSSRPSQNTFSRNQGAPAQQPTQPQPSYQQPTYQPKPAGKKVGDLVYHNGVPGIVVALYDDAGEHGLLVSAEETKCNWSAAKSWCANLGSGWKLPSKSQLQIIYRNKEKINTALAAKGFEPVDGGCLWSSDEYDADYAWYVLMYYDRTGRSRKINDNYVRAVSAF